MKSFAPDSAECATLNILYSVFAIRFGRPVSLEKLRIRTLHPLNSASRRIEVGGMVRTVESNKSTHSRAFEGTLSLCSPCQGEWIAHAGEQTLLLASQPMTFCRMSRAGDMLQTFRLRTNEGHLVLGSNFHDAVIVNP